METKEIVKLDRADVTENGKGAGRSYLDVALIATLAPVVAAAIRIWLYSGGDVTTFLVLLRTLNIPAVLIGTALLLIPYLIVFLTLAFIFDPKSKSWAEWLFSQNKIIVTGVIPLVIMVILFTTPWPVVAGLFVIIATTLIVGVVRASKKKEEIPNKEKGHWRRRIAFDSITVLFTLVFTFTVIQTNMWLPLERVQVKNTDAMTGYILETTDTWTTILTPEHSIDVVRTNDIESRTICKSMGSLTLAMFMQNGGLKDLVDCN